MSYVGYILMGVSAILILIGAISVHRKGNVEAELSNSISQSWMFILGCAGFVIGLVIRVLTLVF